MGFPWDGLSLLHVVSIWSNLIGGLVVAVKLGTLIVLCVVSLSIQYLIHFGLSLHVVSIWLPRSKVEAPSHLKVGFKISLLQHSIGGRPA